MRKNVNVIIKDMKRKTVKLNGHFITVLEPTKTFTYEEGKAKVKEIMKNLSKD
ncbi:MAG: hypothetical protein HY051_04730 [Candidatus Aenigmarchaeota archaeon]|nr:hypothetical protein [Candidatus Aenigmarchaeota archaeon]